jgi:hypothetical protein
MATPACDLDPPVRMDLGRRVDRMEWDLAIQK